MENFATRSAIFALITSIILFGLFKVLAPEKSFHEDLTLGAPVQIPQSAIGGEKAAAPVPLTQEKRFVMTINEAGLVNGPRVIRVQQGETIELVFQSSIKDELHLHGYNRHLDLRPNEVAVMKLELNRSGRFEYELHHHVMEIGALEVLPK